MGKLNKAWETPQLIILARGMPEENVLTQCKAIQFTGTPLAADAFQQNNCAKEPVGNCGACQSRSEQNS